MSESWEDKLKVCLNVLNKYQQLGTVEELTKQKENYELALQVERNKQFDLALELGQLKQAQAEGRLVEVVRCKDCKFAVMTNDGRNAKYCKHWSEVYDNSESLYLAESDYCSYGRRC